jgi:tetratricopeptide (TPR) repeat protein
MGIDYQLDRAWANTAKGVRQCQKADKAFQDGKDDAAADHFDKAINYFAIAVEHLANADDDAYVKAGNLLDDGNQQLKKAIDQWTDGNVDGAVSHYDKALDKYDQALDLVD